MTEISIDLNCDLGEYEQLDANLNDVLIMPWISSCNIACGGHAGNEQVIQQTIELALEHEVKIGAHPSFPDRENFGRQLMKINSHDLSASLQQQILSVKTSAEAAGAELSHVKPHGALYNLAAVDIEVAQLLVAAVSGIDKNLLLYGLAHSAMTTAAADAGIQFVAEGFADRSYTQQRTLVPRNQPNALITEPQRQLSQVLNMLLKHQVAVAADEFVGINVKTVCLHGDHPKAAETASYLYHGLQQAGVKIWAPKQ